MEPCPNNLTTNPGDAFEPELWNKEAPSEDVFKSIKIKNELNVSIERKCGEIYFANHIFHLNCNFCGSKFNTIKVFARHFIQNHSSLNVDQTILALDRFLSDEDEDQNNENLDDSNIKPFDINLYMDVVQEENSSDEKCDEVDLLNDEDIKYEADESDVNELQLSENLDPIEKLEESTEISKKEKKKNNENEKYDNINYNSTDRKSKRIWNCSVCNQPFTRRDNMLRHKWKIHKEKPNPDYGEIRLDCKWCGQHFKRHSDRSRHENQQHDADGKKINRRRNYKENPLERHVCETCGNSYKHAFSLEEHLRVHTGERPYKCEICSATFAKKQNFIVHNKYHSNERRYKCQYCDKGFVQKTKLILHEMVHTGTYKAQCNICGRQFRCGSMLNVHMKRHLYDKCHKCDQCDKRFYTADSLKRHSAVHLDKKPFHCDICLVEFARKCSLRRHKKRHKATEGQEIPKPNEETAKE